MKPKQSIRTYFLALVTAVLAGLILLPFTYLFLLSLAGSWAFPDLFPTDLGLQQWQQLLGRQGELARSFLLSLLLSLLVAFLSTLAGFISSKALATHKYHRQLLILAYFPFVLSPVIYAATLYFFFVKFNLAGHVGGVLLGQLLIAYPYAVILFMGFWNQRLLEYEALAATLGANGWQTFTRVLFPLSKGILLVCFFQTFLISWFEYGLTALIGVGKVQTLTIKVFQFVTEANMYHAAGASCLLILPPALLLWFNKQFVFKKMVL